MSTSMSICHWDRSGQIQCCITVLLRIRTSDDGTVKANYKFVLLNLIRTT